MNTPLAMDTHKTIRNLMAKGYTQEQAEGFVDAIADSELITKSYLDVSLANLKIQILIYLLTAVGLILAGVAVLLQVFVG